VCQDSAIIQTRHGHYNCCQCDDQNTVQTGISCGYPAVKMPIHASIRHYIHGVRAVCHIIGTGLVSRRKRNPFSQATRQQPTDQDRIHRRDICVVSFMAASFLFPGIFGGVNSPPSKLTIPPPTAAKWCSLNLFFRPGVESDGLQTYHGNFLLMDNKHIKLCVIKQSKKCQFFVTCLNTLCEAVMLDKFGHNVFQWECS